MPSNQSLITFHFLTQTSLSERNRLRAFLKNLFRREGFRLEALSFIFCDDVYLLDLNRRYLEHDYYTDILTFPFSGAKSRVISGEVYISVERVRDNAKNLEQTFRQELHRVIFHGALHLCHYRDKTRKETTLMRQKEDHYLKSYFKK
ncbi:MAG TPA: rRNA maturation RNase YbeY [Puia sp.]|nr:rRNA maturation RNase YbeY [Puia sp.]